MWDTIRSYAVSMLLSLPGILFALTVHEYAHALVSSKLGDPLPKASGRLSLNPLRHIDPVGFLALLLLRFGWAKPVYVDPRYYKHKKLDMALTALAGPAVNLVTAFLLELLVLVVYVIVPRTVTDPGTFGATALSVVFSMLDASVLVSVGLGIFNLIPISPLDGSKVLAAFLPLRAYEKVLKYERYGFIVLMILMFGIPGRLLSIFGVPDAVTRWLDLNLYLGAARDAVISVFDGFWLRVLSLVGVL